MPTSICGTRVPGKISVDTLSSGCMGIVAGRVKECPITGRIRMRICASRMILVGRHWWYFCRLTSTLDSWWFRHDGFCRWSDCSRRRKSPGRVGTPTKVFRIKCIVRRNVKTVGRKMVVVVIFWWWSLWMVVDRIFGMGGITVGKTRHGSTTLKKQIQKNCQIRRDSRVATKLMRKS